MSMDNKKLRDELNVFGDDIRIVCDSQSEIDVRDIRELMYEPMHEIEAGIMSRCRPYGKEKCPHCVENYPIKPSIVICTY